MSVDRARRIARWLGALVCVLALSGGGCSNTDTAGADRFPFHGVESDAEVDASNDAGCRPRCRNRECGPDPHCGESCGRCGASKACTSEGRCVASSCRIGEVDSDRPLEVDVDTATVGGRVTVDGKPPNRSDLLPASPRDRLDSVGVFFVDEQNGSVGKSYVSSDEDGRFEVDLFDSSYEVLLEVNLSNYWRRGRTVQKTILRAREALVADEREEVRMNVPMARVRLEVRVDGEQLEARAPGREGSRGRFMFVPSEGEAGEAFVPESRGAGVMRAYLDEKGPSSIERVVPKRPYDVYFASSEAVPNAGDRHMVRVAEDWVPTDGGRLRADLSTVRVRGRVTVDGGPFPDPKRPIQKPRAVVVFANHGRNAGGVSLGTSGPATFETDLYRDRRYDVYVRTLEKGPIAEGYRKVRDDWRPESERSLQIDIGVARVQGRVMVDGKPLPDSRGSKTRATLALVDETVEKPREIEMPLGKSGPATFDSRVLEGTYDVVFRARDVEGLDPLPARFPVVVRDDVRIRADRSFQVDVSPVGIERTLTVDGERMPASEGGQGTKRGEVYVIPTNDSTRALGGTGWYRVESFGAEGPAAVELTLYEEGTYDIFVRGNREAGVLPVGWRRVASGWRTGTAGFDGNLPAVGSVRGRVLLDGSRMPNNGVADGGSRGRLTFDPPGEISTAGWTGFLGAQPDRHSVSLGASRPVNFEMALYEDQDYEISVAGGSGDEQDVLPADLAVDTECGVGIP